MLFLLYALPVGGETTEEPLEIIQIKLNDAISIDSEILILNENIYAPARQLGEIVDIVMEFERSDKILSFTSLTEDKPISIDYANSHITINNSIADGSVPKNKIFLPSEAFILAKDDVLVHIDLLKEFFNIEINYDPDNLALVVKVERKIKLLKKKLQFKEKEKHEIEYVQPRHENISIRTFNLNFNSNAQRQYHNKKRPSEISLSNSASLGVHGEIFQGEYIVGPSLSMSPDSATISGFDQTWTRRFNDKLAAEVGIVNTRASEMTMAGGRGLGVRIGSVDSFGFSNQHTLSFEGPCEQDAEVIFRLNKQKIARQICKTGTYKFDQIPIIDRPDNLYQVAQRTTDGDISILREEQRGFFSGVMPKGKSKWQAGIGKVPKQYNIRLWGPKTESPKVVDKFMIGGSYETGWKERASLGFAAAFDPLKTIDTSESSPPLDGGYLPSNYDEKTHQGGSASVTITAKPFDNLGIKWENALSMSFDGSPTKHYRSGPGFASNLAYDFRNSFFSVQGRAYFLSPNYYSPSGVEPNRTGGSASTSFAVGKHTFNASYQGEVRNVDRRSKGGQTLKQSYLFSHNYPVNSKISIRNNITYRNSYNEGDKSGNFNYKTSANYRVNSKLGFRISGGTSFVEDTENTLKSKFSTGSISGGMNYRFKNGISMGLSGTFYTPNEKGLFIQFRKRFGPIAYEPALNMVWSSTGKTQFVLSNGLYLEQANGVRVGAQYTLSRTNTPILNQTLDASHAANDPDIVTDHSFSLNMSTALGIFDKRPYILRNATSGGYIKGLMFIDLNDNGTQDEGEQSLPDIEFKWGQNKIKSNEEGTFIMADVPAGEHEASLVPESIPFTLSVMESEKQYFEIGKGKVTPVQYRFSMNAGSVSGKISVKDVANKDMSAENLIVVAVDMATGKEVTYVYTDVRGEYMMSELKPGKYKITLDKKDIKKRKLKAAKDSSLEHEIDIPVNLDDFVELEEMDFNIVKTVF